MGGAHLHHEEPLRVTLADNRRDPRSSSFQIPQFATIWYIQIVYTKLWPDEYNDFVIVYTVTVQIQDTSNLKIVIANSSNLNFPFTSSLFDPSSAICVGGGRDYKYMSVGVK